MRRRRRYYGRRRSYYRRWDAITVLFVIAVIASELMKHYLFYLILAGCAVVLIVTVSLVRKFGRKTANVPISSPFAGILRKPLAATVTTMDEIDEMGGIEFEIFLERVLGKMGYSVFRTPPSNDYGVDLILTGKDGKTVAAQAKRTKVSIGNRVIQMVEGGRSYYRCDSALVITTSRFTRSAVKMAKSINVELWDRDRLDEELRTLSRKDSNAGWFRTSLRHWWSRTVRRAGKTPR
jgi:restriction system protein